MSTPTMTARIPLVGLIGLLVVACTGGGPSPSVRPPGTPAGETAAPSPSGPVEPVDLRMAGYLRVTPQGTVIEEPWISAIGERSGGTISIEHNFVDDLGITVLDNLPNVRQGSFDIVLSGVGFAAGELPLVEGVDLAGMYDDRNQARQGMDAFTPALREAMAEELGVHLLGMWALDRQVIFCNQEIASLQDLSGQDVRVIGNTLPDLIQSIGAQTVNIDPAEIYTGLERDLFDCAITGPIGVTGSRLYEVTTHLYNLPLIWAVNFYVMNLDAWEALPASSQEFLQSDFDQLIGQYDEFFGGREQDAINCITGQEACETFDLVSPGLTLVAPTEADQATVADAVGNIVVPSWVERCGAECVDVFNETVGPIVGIEAE